MGKIDRFLIEFFLNLNKLVSPNQTSLNPITNKTTPVKTLMKSQFHMRHLPMISTTRLRRENHKQKKRIQNKNLLQQIKLKTKTQNKISRSSYRQRF